MNSAAEPDILARTPSWTGMLLGLLLLLAGLATSLAGGGLAWHSSEMVEGPAERAFLLLLGLVALGGIILITLGISILARTIHSLRFTANAIEVHRTFGRTRILWSSIRDFGLPATASPTLPRALVLILAPQNEPLALPLNLSPAAPARDALLRYIPGLAHHGLDRPRIVPGMEPDIAQEKGRVRRSAFAGMMFGVLLIVLGVLLGHAQGKEFFRYLKLSSRGEQVTGYVTDIHRGQDRINVGFRYRSRDDVPVLLRRNVAPDFASRLRVDAPVTIAYLPSNPSIGRLMEGDLDTRSWTQMLLHGLPAILIGLLLVRRSAQKWRRPLSRVVQWHPFDGQANPARIPLQDWILIHFARLYSGHLPPELQQTDFLKLLNADPNKLARLRVERDTDRATLWLRQEGQRKATLARLENGQWSVSHLPHVPTL